MDQFEQIKKNLTEAIEGAIVHVLDPRNDGKHLEAIVISPHFEGLSLISQHRLVMNALKKEFSSSLHALSLKTFTPEQWEKAND